MYNDLDENMWSSVGGLSEHPLVGELLGGNEPTESSFATEHDVDASEVAAKVRVLVLEADASQHSAILDVMSGKNLVIEGPPGTGKSQTITNIVASALADGRRVLFMADKLAALQVVKDRLDKVGLGDFCLELHSGKARKKDVLDGLKQRIENRPQATGFSALDEKVRELAAMRTALTRYVDVLNGPLGACGATVHDVLWGDRRCRDGEGDQGARLDAVPVPDCERLTRSDIERRKSILDRLERAAKPILSAFGSPVGHPWSGVTRGDLPSVDFDQVISQTTDLALSMEKLGAAASELGRLGVDSGGTIEAIQQVASALAGLPVTSQVTDAFYDGLADVAVRRAVTDWLCACEVYERARAALDPMRLDLDLREFDEAAAVLSAIWEGLASTARQRLVIADLGDWTKGLRERAIQLLHSARAANKAAQLFGLGPHRTSRDLATILAGIDLARSVGDEVIKFTSPEITASESHDIVARAADTITDLKARGEAIAAEYNIPVSVRPEELRRHAANLRAAGSLWFLSSSVKLASRRYAELRVRPGKKTRRDMAAHMTFIAEHVEAVLAVAGNPQYRLAFGTRFNGIATDVEAAKAVINWAADVRSVLPGMDEVSIRVRQTLLAGDPDRLQAIRAMTAAEFRHSASTLPVSLIRPVRSMIWRRNSRARLRRLRRWLPHASGMASPARPRRRRFHACVASYMMLTRRN